MSVRPVLSHIEDHEIAEAQRQVDAFFIKSTGKPFDMKVGGYYLACRIYVRPEELKVIKRDDGTEATLWRPDSTREHDKFQSCSALVCGIGPQAFTGHDIHGHQRFPAGAQARVGDWIAIPRQQSFMLTFRGVALAILPDDMILGVVADPADIAPITQAALI